MTDHDSPPILEVRTLKKHYPIVRGFLRRVVGYVKAVDGVTFTVPEGKTLGLVGESGCGKTTTGHCIMRGIQPTSGQIIFHDKDLPCGRGSGGQEDTASLAPQHANGVSGSKLFIESPYDLARDRR